MQIELCRRQHNYQSTVLGSGLRRLHLACAGALDGAMDIVLTRLATDACNQPFKRKTENRCVSSGSARMHVRVLTRFDQRGVAFGLVRKTIEFASGDSRKLSDPPQPLSKTLNPGGDTTVVHA